MNTQPSISPREGGSSLRRGLAVLMRYGHPVFLRNLLGLLVRRHVLRQPIVIVERKAGMGDVIFTLPACRVLREREPRVHLVYLSSTHVLPMLRRSGAVDRVMSADYRKGLLALVRPWRFILFETPDDRGEGIREHLIRLFLAQVGGPTDGPLAVTLPGRRPPEPGVKPYIVIHAGPTWPVREWPGESWARLVGMLAGEGFEVQQIGDQTKSLEFTGGGAAVPGATVRIGQLDLDGLTGLVAGARLFIGIDSGPLYLAAALGVPVAGLFGPVNPAYRLFGTQSVGCFAEVDCRFCHHEPQRLHWKSNCPHGIRCMSALQPESVFAAAMALLDKAQRAEDTASL